MPDVPFPGAELTLEDCRGLVQSFRVLPRQAPRWLKAVANKLYSGVTRPEDYQANFEQHEKAIINRLKKNGITTVVVSTERAEQDIRKVLRALARPRR